MRIPLPAACGRLAALALTAFRPAMAQTPRRPTSPAAKPVRSIPYVSITGDDGRQRHYETNAIPLLFNRACFGWRMYLGGPNRVVSLNEVLTTSQPAEQVIAGPETEVSADKTRATTRMREACRTACCSARGASSRAIRRAPTPTTSRSTASRAASSCSAPSRCPTRTPTPIRATSPAPTSSTRSSAPAPVLAQGVVMAASRPRPAVLCILDGWGHRADPQRQRHPRRAHAQLRPADRDLPAGR